MGTPIEPMAEPPKKPKARTQQHSEHTQQTAPGVEVVVRHCKVCEWKGELIELAGTENPDCPWCHGPTELEATLATSSGPVPGDKNPHAAALGRLGGLKGGRARAEALTPTQRHRIALRAARARWEKKKDKDGR
jgi:hypothetical protein